MGKTANNTGVVKNYVYNVSYQILVMLLPLVTTPYVSRVLGVEGVGAFSYTSSVTTYFSFLGILGLGTYGQLQIARNRDDRQQLSVLFKELAITRLITVGISIALFMIVILLDSRYRLLYCMQVITLFANALDISWFFQGIENFKQIAVRNFVVKIISVVLIFLLVKNHSDIYVYAAITNGATLMGNIVLFPVIRQYIEPIKNRRICIKKHIKGAFQYFIPAIATVIMISLDKVMIGGITGSDAESGYYAQAYKIEFLVFTLFSSLNVVMRSRMANMFSKDAEKKIVENLKKSLKFTCMLSIPIAAGVFGIAEKFVPWFYGNGYDKVVGLLKIFSVWIAFKAVSNCILEQSILPSGKQGLYGKIIWCGAITNIILNTILIPQFSSIGAAVASVAAEVVICIITVVKCNHIWKEKDLIISICKYIVSSIVMLCAIIIINNLLNSFVLTTCIQIFVGCVIYVGCLILFREGFFVSILSELYERIRKV